MKKHNEITFNNNQKLILKIYGPVNTVSSYEELFINIQSSGSSTDEEGDSPSSKDENTKLADELTTDKTEESKLIKQKKRLLNGVVMIMEMRHR